MTILRRKIPKFTKSFWREEHNLPSFSPLSENLATDITIVGAGITGITIAYLLAKEGIKVVLIDAGKIIDGTTGYTTAKISSQHGLIYDELIKNIGLERARLYYESNEDALAFIRQTVDELGIDCDLTNQDSYVYSTSKSSKVKVEKEADAYKSLGLDGGLASSEEVQLPFEWENAIVMRNQAQFHPVKYLSGLVSEIQKHGGQIFEDTRAGDINRKGEMQEVITTEGHHIQCNQVIVSSHFPFNDFEGLYFSRLHIERSYSIAARVQSPIPDGMYLSADSPSRSLRSALGLNGEKLLLIGGEGHPTGQSHGETIENYEKLADFGLQHFNLEEISYHWSAQDIITLDKIPYIGAISSDEENVLVATGFAKWGMTNGTTAALLLKDRILQKENPYHDLFDPSRSELTTSGIKSFVKENADVAKEFVKGKVKRKEKELKDLDSD
ncbi:NAD(P)/FAD-dependent oxidoreductase [Sutcliffiella deserti]|uniref:NAD(P)/FAD-dependent oxidoreductase n=1 Tax=Sutcliffiella deserti TaxID=2875501 RepID=UPI00295B8924|nr:FAD-binding oxidoreductase [Sutcliffiella deserti]